jgi:hypothetical protein
MCIDWTLRTLIDGKIEIRCGITSNTGIVGS